MSVYLPTPRTAQFTGDGDPCQCKCHSSPYPCFTFFDSPCCYYPSIVEELHDRKVLDKESFSGKELGRFLDELNHVLPWYVKPLRFILERAVRKYILRMFKAKGLVR